jgi:prepilin-type N-terminal cleavage/methylation domain-containing protein
MSRRTGFSLVEVLVVITMLAMTLSFSAVLIATVGRSERLASATVQRVARHAELADLFRADAAAAEGVELAPNRVAFRLPGGKVVTYSVDGAAMTRTEQVAGQPPRRRALKPGPAEAAVEFFRPTNGLVGYRVTELSSKPVGLAVEVIAAVSGGGT